MSEVFGASDRLLVRLATNTVVQAVGQVAASLISIVTFIAVTRALGPEGYGDYTASLAFIFIPVVLVDIGLSTAVVRQISARPETAERMMRTTVPLRAVISLVVVSAILGGATVAPVSDQTRLGIVIGSVGAIAILMTGSISPIFQAQLQQHWYVLANVAGRIVTLVLTLAALEADHGFEGVVWANVAGLWVTTLLCGLAARRLVRLGPVVDVDAWRTVVRGAAALGLAMGLGQVYLRIDALLLAFLKPEYEVGIYGAAWRFVEFSSFVAAAVAVTVLPALSRFVASDDARLRQITSRVLDVMLVGAIPITILYAAFAEEIVVFSAGAEFSEGGTALRILAAYVPMMFVGMLLWNVLIAHGADRTLLRIGLSALVSNVGLNLALIPPFGYRGAAAAALCSEALVMTLGAFAVRRIQGLPALGYLRVLLPAALAMVILVVVLPGPPLLVSAVAAAAYCLIVGLAPGTGRDAIARVARVLRRGEAAVAAPPVSASATPDPAPPATKPPRASVVIPSRNAEGTIAETLSSLERQSWSDTWEVVVSDNGSTDRTLEIVESYRGRLPALTVVDSRETIGCGHARNAGVARARGELLLFVDADDVVAPGWLAALAGALEEADLAISRIEFDRLNPPWARATRSGQQDTRPVEWWFGGTYFPFGYGGTLGVRRDWHERIGGWDAALLPAGEDMDYCWRLQEGGARVAFVPDALIHYRLRTTLRGLYFQARAYGESWPIVYKKHRPSGLPPARRLSAKVVREWLHAFRHVLLLHRRDRRARLVWELGAHVGMIRGCVRARVLLL